nr:hypothetical protein [Bacteroidota bacterium]
MCTAQSDSLLNVLADTDIPEEEVDLLNELADIYTFRNLDSARRFAEEATIISKNADYKSGEINALIIKCEIAREYGEFDQSEAYADRVREYAEELPDKNLYAKYLLLKGVICLDQQKINQALEKLNESLALFREQGNLIGMGDAQRRIAVCFSTRNEFEIMKEYEMSALDCYEKAGYKRGIASLMNNIGVYYLRVQKDNNMADGFFRKAIMLNRDAGNDY